MTTLKERLADWNDVDGAMHHLGSALGLWPEFGSGEGDPWQGVKWVMWSNNPTGRYLYDALCAMRDAGMLLHDAEEQRFKWNPQFTIKDEE